MQTLTMVEWVTLAALCAATAWLAALFLRPRSRIGHGFAAALRAEGAPVLLFDADTLIDATRAGHALLGGNGDMSDWTRLHRGLASRFPALPRSPQDTDTAVEPRTVFRGANGTEELVAERIDGLTRLHLRAQPDRALPEEDAQRRELEVLRLALNDAPYPAWQVDETGQVRNHNVAYAELVDIVHGTAPDPARVLFETQFDNQADTARQRVSLALPRSETRLWYDVFMVRHDGFRQFFAIDMNAVVSAEIAQRNFVQTLAKTFAQLSIGLAIFDRNRQLALFNPALIDLTNLPADFLSGRPNLLTFFDRLRDNWMMPEPKNYGSWRHQMADLVAAADDGRYHETWSLPSGSVYSVSGRPHPDGAVAFLFEDITAEVTLTRRFRADVELQQSILDRVDEAIAVFSPAGVLTLSNHAYRRLWGVDPDGSFADVSIIDSIRVWQDKCLATPIWGEIRDFLSGPDQRSDWWAPVRLRDGTGLTCSVHPVHFGATMVSFARETGPAEAGSPIEPADVTGKLT